MTERVGQKTRFFKFGERTSPSKSVLHPGSQVSAWFRIRTGSSSRHLFLCHRSEDLLLPTHLSIILQTDIPQISTCRDGTSLCFFFVRREPMLMKISLLACACRLWNHEIPHHSLKPLPPPPSLPTGSSLTTPSPPETTSSMPLVTKSTCKTESRSKARLVNWVKTSS